MFNMNIKPRLANIESGAIVQHIDGKWKGFVVVNSTGHYQVVYITNDGGMALVEKEYAKEEHNTFFSTYKMVAQSNEYEGRLEGVTNDNRR